MFGQLSIRNSNYLFVSDRVIFSQDYINLNESESQFFLRDEAQLVQGTGVTGNNGIGELSLYQDGNVGAHEYNYWCSPISQRIPSSINNLFGISLLNDINSSILSTPVSYIHANDYNGTATPLNIEPYWIWKFIASDEYSEWVHVQGNTTINPGEGFTMKGTAGTSVNNPGDNQNYDFRGKPNTGTISNPVLTNQFSLVGNPYPSALDAVAYIHDAENTSVINGTLYYWEQDLSVDSHYINDYDGGYATYTISSDGSIETYVPAVFYKYNGDGTVNSLGNGVPSGKLPKRYIPIAQGFMVEGMSDGIVKTKNSHRVYMKESNSNSSFFRQNNQNVNLNETIEFNENYSRLRINVTFNDSYTRQLVKTFTPIASLGFDYGLESINNDLLVNDCFFSDEEFNYIAQASSFDLNMSIPLKFVLENENSIAIDLVSFQGFDNTPIYIYDDLNEMYIDLKQQVFDFNLNLDEYYPERFSIVFQIDNSLGLTEFNENNGLSLIHEYLKENIIISNINNLSLNNLLIYDTLGRLIRDYELNTSDYNVLKPVNDLPNGTYIAQCYYNDNNKIALKFVKK